MGSCVLLPLSSTPSTSIATLCMQWSGRTPPLPAAGTIEVVWTPAARSALQPAALQVVDAAAPRALAAVLEEAEASGIGGHMAVSQRCRQPVHVQTAANAVLSACALPYCLPICDGGGGGGGGGVFLITRSLMHWRPPPQI